MNGAVTRTLLAGLSSAKNYTVASLFGARHIPARLRSSPPDGVPALTEAGLGEVLDALHDEMMEWISSNEPFPEHWAGRKFVELLKRHAAGQPLATLFES